MKIAVAMDSMKGSLSSLEAGYAVEKGIRLVIPEAEVVVRPLADGGEGMVDALNFGRKGRLEKILVSDPLGRKVKAFYTIVEDEKTAIIEMAQAAGITLIEKTERNPLETTTFGVGEIIRDAIEKGCRKFLIGIGGSATNDGGCGMLQALGFDLLDKNKNPIPLGAKGLKELATISEENVLSQLKECTFKVACDVNNPLCGENGCSFVFATQKGATPDMMREMDAWLMNYAKLTKESYPNANWNMAGTGAAGGMGFALLSCLKADLVSGVSIVLEETKLEDYVKDVDLVITGEGKMDAQSLMGKAPIGVAKLTKKYHKKVLAFAGSVSEDARLCNEHGIDAFFSILQKATSLSDAMNKENAEKNLIATVEQVMRLFKMNVLF